MEIQSDQTGAVTALETSGERAVVEVAQPTNSHDARLSRVLDYQVSSLQKDDPLEANLGSINSGIESILFKHEKLNIVLYCPFKL